jgi:transitional endoplasmic reticulum ATPase
LFTCYSENASITAPSIDPEHDPATAILRKKSAPNKLIVDDATNDDNSVLALSTATMEKLQFFRGDMVLVKGKKRRDTVLIVLADDSIEDSKVRINKGKQSSQGCFIFAIFSDQE